MPKEMRICKACGKPYEACHTPNNGVFRWRDVACSPECAEKYIHDVLVARGEITEQADAHESVEPAVIETPDTTDEANVEAVANDDAEASAPAAKRSRAKKK